MKMMTVSCRTAEYSVITIRVQTVMRKCKSIVKMAQADNFDFLALLDGNTFVGFMVVQTYEDMAYLFFLRLIQRVGVRGMVAEPLKL